jgi:hypothetical protein
MFELVLPFGVALGIIWLAVASPNFRLALAIFGVLLCGFLTQSNVQSIHNWSVVIGAAFFLIIIIEFVRRRQSIKL